MSQAPTISVVIPTRNAGPGLAQTLDAILAQQVEGELEILLIDSGSTDGTVALARTYPVTLIEIPPASFRHGRTRNLGICRTRGRFVALLVQDAVPADATWLSALIAPLEADARAAGTFSQQIPRPAADWVSRHVTHDWHRRTGGRRILEIDNWEPFAALPWDEKLLRCGFNDVSSAVRRDVWEQIPLPDVPYAEDVAWALEVLRAGYRLVYEPASQVIHSHQRSWQHDLRRAAVDASTLAELFRAEMARPGPAAIERTLRWALDTCRREGIGPSDLITPPPAVREAAAWYREHLTTPALVELLRPDSPWPSAHDRPGYEVLARHLQWEDLRPRPDGQPKPGVTTLRRLNASLRRRWLGVTLASGGRVPLPPSMRDRAFEAFWNGFGWQHIHWAVIRAMPELAADALDRMAAGEFWSYARQLAQAAQADGVRLDAELATRIWRHAAATTAGKWLGRADHAWGDATDTPPVLEHWRVALAQGETEWDLASRLS